MRQSASGAKRGTRHALVDCTYCLPAIPWLVSSSWMAQSQLVDIVPTLCRPTVFSIPSASGEGMLRATLRVA